MYHVKDLSYFALIHVKATLYFMKSPHKKLKAVFKSRFSCDLYVFIQLCGYLCVLQLLNESNIVPVTRLKMFFSIITSPVTVKSSYFTIILQTRFYVNLDIVCIAINI